MAVSRLAGGPEFDFIRSVLRGARSPSHPLVKVGAGDDCAIVGDLAISTDASVEGVHFRREWLTPEEIGARAAAAALSDLAAVAAEPVGVLVSLILPSADRTEFAHAVMAGVVAAAERAGATLLGGDTAGGAQLVLDVVVIGRTAQPVLRSGARPGDEIWVTGWLGGSAAAVAAWQRGAAPAPAARVRYAAPRPRIAEARWLAGQLELHAMIDLSDGLFGDVAHIAAASGCAIELTASAVPVDVEAGARYEQAVSGGEDYELCFVAAADAVEPLRAGFAAQFGIPLTRVGTVRAGGGVVENNDGVTRTIEQGGYQHFKE